MSLWGLMAALWESIIHAAQSPVTLLIWLLLLVMAAVAKGVLGRGRRVEGQLSGLLVSLDSIDMPGKERGIKPATLDLIEGEIGKAEQLNGLLESWRELRAALPEQKDGTRRRTAHAEEYVHDDDALGWVSWAFLGRTFNFTESRRFPAMMTALGMLGTFIGIAVGLGRIDIESLAGGNAQSIQPVIIGLASAFWTSIVALAFSIVLSFRNHSFEAALLDVVHRLRASLDRLIPRASAEELLVQQLQQTDRLLEEAISSRTALQTLANDLASKFDDSLQNNLVPLLKEMTTAVREQLDTAQSSSVEAARGFADETFKQFGQRLDDTFSSIANAADDFGGQFRQATDGLQTSVESMHAASAEQRQMLEAATAAMKDTLVHRETASHELAQVKQAAARLSTVIQGVTQNQQRAESLQTDQTELVAKSMQAHDRMLTDLNAATEAYKETAGTLAELLPDLSSAGIRVAGAVDNLSDRASTAADRLDGVADKLGSRIQAEHELLRLYQDAGSTLSSSLSSSQATLTRLAQSLAAFDGARGGLEKLTTELSGLVASNATTSKSAAETLQAAATSLTEVAGSLRNVADDTVAWAGQASSAIETFGSGLQGSVKASLTEYDKQLKAAVTSISGGLKELDQVVEDLAASLTQPPAGGPR